MIHLCDGQTDGRTADSMYAVTRRNSRAALQHFNSTTDVCVTLALLLCVFKTLSTASDETKRLHQPLYGVL